MVSKTKSVYSSQRHVTGGLGGAFMQKDAQWNDRILAYGNRTLLMPERNFSIFKNKLSGVILCFEHSVDEKYLQAPIF